MYSVQEMPNGLGMSRASAFFRSYGILFLIAMIGATSLPKKIWVRASTTTIGGNIVIFAEPMAVCVMLVVCTAYLVDGSFNPFLYFRF